MFEKIFRPKTDHPDPEVRLSAVKSLSGKSSRDVELLHGLIRQDPDHRIRSQAIEQINSLDGLKAIFPEIEKDLVVQARQKLGKMLEAETDLDSSAAMELFILAGDPVIQRRLISEISDPSHIIALLDKLEDESSLEVIALNCTLSKARKTAAEKISAADILKRLQHESNDKNVLQIARQKIAAVKACEKAKQHADETLEKICLAVEKLAGQEYDDMLPSRLNVLESRWRDVDDEYKTEKSGRYQKASRYCRLLITQADEIAAREELRISQEQLCIAICDEYESEISRQETGTKNQWLALKENINLKWLGVCREYDPPAIVRERFYTLENIAGKVASTQQAYGEIRNLIDVEHLDRQESGLLSDLENKLYLLVKTLNWSWSFDPPVAYSQIRSFHVDVRKILLARREELKKNISLLDRKIGVLKSHIHQKNLIKANRLFNYIENLTDELPAEEKIREQKKLEPVVDALEELRGLSRFITQPKKEKLCQEMMALADSDSVPELRLKKIKTLQRKWKSLATSDSETDDLLWDKFKQAADKAYEPCAAWLENLEKIKQENLKQRKQLSEKVSQEVSAIDWGRADWKQIQRLYNQSWNKWRSLSPVFFSENKPVQQRFEKIMNQLKEKLDYEKGENHALYDSLIEKASTLAHVEENELEDSIAKIKRLQIQWKNIGLANFKKREKQWKAFRVNCDKIFDRQREIVNKINTQQNIHAKQALDLANRVSELTGVSDAELSATAEEFQQIQAEFDAIGPLPEKRDKYIRNNFLEACQQYQDHVAGLPRRCEQSRYQSLRQASAICCKIETVALKDGSVQDFETLKSSFDSFGEIDSDIWQNLSRRVTVAKNVIHSNSEYPVEDLQQNANKLGEIAIQLEVLFDLDSPDDAKQQRMNYQLGLLQQGLKRALSDEEKLHQLQRAEQRWYSIGATFSQERTVLEGRLQAVIKNASRSH